MMIYTDLFWMAVRSIETTEWTLCTTSQYLILDSVLVINLTVNLYCYLVLGREEGQLWYPRKVAVVRTNGKYIVCDRGNERSRMQIFTKFGAFVKKIAIRYIDIVAGLAITSQGEFSDYVNIIYITFSSYVMLKWKHWQYRGKKHCH